MASDKWAVSVGAVFGSTINEMHSVIVIDTVFVVNVFLISLFLQYYHFSFNMPMKVGNMRRHNLFLWWLIPISDLYEWNSKNSIGLYDHLRLCEKNKIKWQHNNWRRPIHIQTKDSRQFFFFFKKLWTLVVDLFVNDSGSCHKTAMETWILLSRCNTENHKQIISICCFVFAWVLLTPWHSESLIYKDVRKKTNACRFSKLFSNFYFHNCIFRLIYDYFWYLFP